MRHAIVAVAVTALLLPWTESRQRLAAQQAPTAGGFSVVEASITDMRDAMAGGRTTAHEIVRQSLDRIATFEDQLNAAITLNPRALAEADALDRERRRGHVRGPLHGI